MQYWYLLFTPPPAAKHRPPSKVLVEIDSEDDSYRIELLRRLLVVLFESVEED